MDMGLDSLSAVEFRNRVQASFDGLHLASTVARRCLGPGACRV